MTTSNAIAGRDLGALRAAVAGGVFSRGDHGYDQARRAWNLTADERPAVVVVAGSAADVVAAVRFARSRGMRIAPQGTGHGSVPLEPLAGAMLLRTARMRGVRIDPAARTARAEAGAVWQDVTVPAAEYGLAALAGSSPDVGVTGYTLGGGMGWLARRYGLAANSVTAAEVVTMDGRLRRADAGHEPDLLWAVKGGGGSVGVVTALQMRLYPVRELYAGALFFPLQRAAEIGAFLAGFPATAIDALITVAGPDADTPLASIEVRHLGGALGRPASDAGAQPTIDASYAMFAAGFTPTPELAATVRGHAQTVKDALTPWHVSYDYYNFEETPAPASAVLPPASYHRLQKIKASYDPDQAIISAHPVRPVRLVT
ncbi:MAG TPA: FAD-dependent oxidoreductase [Streptosporangiaceae bacterium]|nr:FAD-dependent oxidoreductase [Streptosporangiaceae bacterium]